MMKRLQAARKTKCFLSNREGSSEVITILDGVGSDYDKIRRDSADVQNGIVFQFESNQNVIMPQPGRRSGANANKQLSICCAGPDCFGITSRFLARRPGCLWRFGRWSSGSLHITAKNTRTHSARCLLNARPLSLSVYKRTRT